MATVWLAHDLKHDRPVALKLLHPELAHALGPERFLREIRLAARLQHPHILSVYDSGAAARPGGGAELLWFTMPLVEGETLRARLRRERQLPLADALRITRETADALEYAHLHGVIHRDIKPENILLGAGHALVGDFGIARALGGEPDDRLTETGVAVGTPHYMSPEQAAGERTLDPRSDVYSLGCVLYEMLAGEPPFTGPSQQAILAKRLSEPAPRLRTLREVPPHVEDALARALARAPADRFASMAQLAAALEAPAAGGVAAVPVRAAPRRPPARWLALAAGLLAAVAGGWVALHRGPPDAAAPAASAAVLPFADMSPARDQEYFSDGLTDELITSLSQIEGLRVAARTSSFQFKGQNADVRDVGRRLGVGAVLEGSVRRSGTRLRVNAQLVSARDGYQLWSQSYDRDLADIFAVQEDIARAIVLALRVRLGAGGDSALATRPTSDLEAYDLYLKGRFAWNQRSEASLPEAVRWFEQAIARDSGFTRAWAGLADAALLLPSYASVSPAVSWPKAKSAATRALALDGSSAEAYTSLAYGSMIYEWEWDRAERLFRRAIAADPAYPTAHHWYGDFLTGRGRFDEALAEMRRAQELDPLSRIIGSEVGWVLYSMGRNREAIEQEERTIRLDPNFAHTYFVRGLAQIRSGQPPEAVASLRRAIALGGFYSHQVAGLVAAYAAAGDTASATRLLEEMRRRSERTWVSPFAFAAAYTGLGRRREAMVWLDRGIQLKDLMLSENFFDPLLDPLRHDPGYPRILGGMGLAK